MNAVATTGTSQAGLPAFMVPTAPAAPTSPAFVNMIILMLGSPDQASPQRTINLTPPQSTASPTQIADAMIRSMLGSGMSGGSTSGPATTLNQAVPVSTLATLPASVGTATPVPAVAPAPVPTGPAPNDLIAPVIVAASTGNPPAPIPASPNLTQAPRKQSGSTIDMLPTVTISVTSPAQPVIVPMVPAGAPPARNSVASATITGSTPQSPAAAPSTTPAASVSPEAKLAFTAILTPMKETAAMADAASSSNPSPPAIPAAASNPAQLSALQGLQSPAGGNPQSGGDTPSQQQNGSPQTPPRPIAPASETRDKPTVPPDENALPAASIAVPFGGAAPTEPAHATAAMRSAETAAAATPYQSTADALRTTESDLAAAPQVRTGAAQEISIRIAPPDAPAVDLRFVERSGQVHVDVRTPDAAMQSSLRQDLGTLTNSLERAGYHAETFTPASTLARTQSSAQTSNQNQQDPSQDRGGSGDSSGGRRQQQPQKRPGTWLEELEEKS